MKPFDQVLFNTKFVLCLPANRAFQSEVEHLASTQPLLRIRNLHHDSIVLSVNNGGSAHLSLIGKHGVDLLFQEADDLLQARFVRSHLHDELGVRQVPVRKVVNVVQSSDKAERIRNIRVALLVQTYESPSIHAKHRSKKCEDRTSYGGEYCNARR